MNAQFAQEAKPDTHGKKWSWLQRRRIKKALLRGDATASEIGVEPLIGLLGDGDCEVRRKAAVALAEIGDDRAVEALIDLLGDREAAVRRAAVETLGRIGDERGVAPLIDALGKSGDGDVRRAAAQALAEIGAPQAVDKLIAVLQDKDSLVREGAAEALVRICKSHVHLKDQVLAELQRLAGGDLTDVAATGTAEMAKLLIEAGADVNARTSPGGYTPLIIAAARGKAAVVQVLLDAGADIYLQGDDGLTAERKAYDSSEQTDLNKHYVATYKLLEGARKRSLQASQVGAVDGPAKRQEKEGLSYADLVGTWCTQTERGIHKYVFGEDHLLAVIRTEDDGARYPGIEYTEKYVEGDKLLLVHTARYGGWIETWGHYTGDTVVFISEHKEGLSGKEDVQVYNWKFWRCGEDDSGKTVKPAARRDESVSATPTSPYGRQISSLAETLRSEHGPLSEAVFRPNKDALLVFTDGTVLSTDDARAGDPLSLLDFGYKGTGPSSFTAFLRASGFTGISYEDISEISDPLRLRPDGSRISGTSTDVGIVWEDESHTPEVRNVSRLVDNGDGTVTDTKSGLMWQRDEDGTERDYATAEKYCERLALGGQTDWRLPSKEELVKLAAVGIEELEAAFPDLERERYWAASPGSQLTWADAPEQIAYTVDFDPDSGNYRQAITYFRTFSYFVRAVRL